MINAGEHFKNLRFLCQKEGAHCQSQMTAVWCDLQIWVHVHTVHTNTCTGRGQGTQAATECTATPDEPS